MKLVDHDGVELVFDAAAHGDHAALLTVRDMGEGVEATYVLRPDSAVALAAALIAWADERIDAGGIF